MKKDITLASSNISNKNFIYFFKKKERKKIKFYLIFDNLNAILIIKIFLHSLLIIKKNKKYFFI
jgi:hypothetical protein